MRFNSSIYHISAVVLLSCYFEIALGTEQSLPTPTIHPVDTVFTHILEIALSKSCEDECCKKAEIFYTIDGTDPRESSSALEYKTPFKIGASTDVKAYLKAMKECITDSKLVEKKFKKIESLPLPVVLPKESRVVFGEKISITITGFEEDERVQIFYTLDGSDPSTSGIRYIEPFALHRSCILRAIAVSKTGKYLNSPVFYRKYTCYIALSPEPTFIPSSTNFNNQLSVSLVVRGIKDDDEVTIYYTVDGRDPTIFHLLYKKPIIVTTTTEIKAIAVRKGYRPSKVVSEHYSLGPLPVIPRPEIFPEGGIYGGGIPLITLKSKLEKAMVLYTLDGTEPTMASELWDGKTIELQQPATIKVKLYKNDWVPSVTVSERYEFETLPEPIANYEHGTVFPDTLNVVLKVPGFLNEVGIKIYFTLDGSDPRKMGQLFQNNIVLSKSCILRTFTRNRGYYDSKVNKYEYFNLIRVDHAYYQDKNKDGKIESAILCFDKQLHGPPSLIEFTDPYTGRKQKVFDTNISSPGQGARNCLTISFIRPFGGTGSFVSGHYGRIPLPGEFDTSPFLIHDSTGISTSFSPLQEKNESLKKQFDDGSIGIINNPFLPGKTQLPEFIQELNEFITLTGTAIVIKPQYPSEGFADIYDEMGNQVVIREKLLEDPATGNLYLIWDGMNRIKMIVPKGTYLIVITAKEKQSGKITENKVKITVME